MKLLIVAVFAASMAAQETGSIEGTVTDNVTGAPVRQAQVLLQPRFAGQFRPGQPQPAPPVAMSDAGGAFRFRDLVPGRYSVMAHHFRYPGDDPREAEVEVKTGETARITVALEPGGSISGRIVDEDGDPIQGCFIALHLANRTTVVMSGQGTENSNDNGEYRSWGIRKGHTS